MIMRSLFYFLLLLVILIIALPMDGCDNGPVLTDGGLLNVEENKTCFPNVGKTGLIYFDRGPFVLKAVGNSYTTKLLPVKENQWYVISGYMNIKTIPKPITNLLIQVYDTNGNWLYNAADYTFSVVGTNKWEEFISSVYTKAVSNRKVGSIRLNLRYKESPNSVLFRPADIMIKGLGIKPAPDSSKLYCVTPPEDRVPFIGNRVRIDKLGNWELKEGNVWKSFFPLIVYPNFNDANWNKYKEHGFNTVTQIKAVGVAKKAIAAKLYWMWDITDFLYSADAFPGSSPYTGDVNKLQQFYNNFKRDTNFDRMIAFYWDNEDLNEWDSVKVITEKIRSLTKDVPIYMNSKHISANPLFMNDEYQFIDLQGCYINPITNPHTKGYQSEWAQFVINDKFPRLKSPPGIGVINVPHEGDYIEPIIFAGIARGMRGFAFWRDTFNGTYAIESRPWWKTFSKTASKIEAMQPLIRQPHNPCWKLTYSIPEREDTLIVGKRVYNGSKYIILASFANVAQNITFTLEKDIQRVVDYFSKNVVATPSSNQFKFTIGAHETAVLRID